MRLTMGETSGQGKSSDFSGQWQHTAKLPIQVSPLFVWPPDASSIGRWIWGSWFFITERTIVLIAALISWFFFQPQLEETRILAPGWIALMLGRNLILMTIVAGGLHLYFYTFRRQGRQLRYDTRDLAPGSRPFTLNSQLLDNMVWTLGSGVAVWTAYEVLMLWAIANGHAPILPWAGNPVWFVALVFLTPMWISFHFYWVHRWLHWPPLYRLAHSLHHRNTNVGPWSGLSMHPLEHLIFFSSVLVHWFVAAHPIHILFHMQHQALTAATSHTGFEGLVIARRSRFALGTFHHQMHHRYFDCNYGNLEVPWDKWLGSFHDGSNEAHQRLKQRRARTAAG